MKNMKPKTYTKDEELKLWLKITKGQTLPAGAYEIYEVQTEELDKDEKNDDKGNDLCLY